MKAHDHVLKDRNGEEAVPSELSESHHSLYKVMGLACIEFLG